MHAGKYVLKMLDVEVDLALNVTDCSIHISCNPPDLFFFCMYASHPVFIRSMNYSELEKCIS